MAITYELDHDLNVIFETWVGTITADSLSKHWCEYLSDPEVLKCRRTLVDLRGCLQNNLTSLKTVRILCQPGGSHGKRGKQESWRKAKIFQ